MPTFWNHGDLRCRSAPTASAAPATSSAAACRSRQDNSIGYFLPSNIGGFYGQAHGRCGRERHERRHGNGRYVGGQFGFRAGPFDVAVAYVGSSPCIVASTASNADWRQRDPVGEKDKTCERRRLVGLRLPEADGLLRRGQDSQRAREGRLDQRHHPVRPVGSARRLRHAARWTRTRLGLRDSDLDNIKATYQYNLSKRTAMYGTVASLSNKDNTIVSPARYGLRRCGCRPRAARRRASSSAFVTSSDPALAPASSSIRSKAAFGRPFSWPLARSHRGQSLLTLGARFALIARRDDGAADSFRVRRSAAAAGHRTRRVAARFIRCSPGPCSPSSFADSSRPSSSC